MGIVYLAEDPKLGRKVAIKTVKMPDHSKPDEHRELMERFLREARTVASLAHPNIVAIHDLLDDDNSVYVVMEYVAGSDLEGRLRAPMLGRFITKVALDAAAALDHAHSKGIVHRDVKPANLLVAESGDVKVTDFGIAKVTAGATMTGTGLLVGTIEYISPEQLMGSPLDGRADQFSLAVLVYQLLTGTKLYDAKKDGPAVLYQILEVTPPAPSSLNPSLPAAVDAVIAKALSKKPDQRYRNCLEFARTLEAAMNPAAPPVRPPAVVTRAEKTGEIRVNPHDGQRYIFIPSGTFLMGSSAGDEAASGDEKPPHHVRITKGFWLGQTPVTQRAW